ncbi:MAG: hypothetical protein WCA13_12300 [Terriglobales bacterium]
MARFCCSCGQALGPASRAFPDGLDQTVSAKLDELLRTKYKDQKLIDIETTELVVTRVQNWAKLFAFFVAVPLFLILAAFGALGYRKYTDFADEISKMEDTQLNDLRTQANNVKLALDEVSNKVETIESIQKAANKRAGLRLVVIKAKNDAKRVKLP